MLLSNHLATICIISLAVITTISIVTFLHTEAYVEITHIDKITLQGAQQFSKSTLSVGDVVRNECNQCLRPIPIDGVEDLFCKKRPRYVKSLQNPCWYNKEKKLRCLPYFHILGCAKCATTDLANRLSFHPDIVGPDGAYNKETLWWSWRRYGHLGYKHVPVSNFQRYTKYFDPIAQKITSGMMKGDMNHTRLITMDGSPPDFWDFRSWTQLPQNHKKKVPCVVTPHLMKHLYPDPKFILILRNPTDRLYSSYLFHHMGESAEEFDEDVRISMKILNKCQEKHSRKECYYSSQVYNNLPTRLHFGCYSVYMKEWLAVFPRSHFLVLKTEEYTQSIRGHLEKIFSFLRLDPVSSDVMENMSQLDRLRVTKLKEQVGPMLSDTRKILDNFYSSCNKELADLLGEEKFLWK